MIAPRWNQQVALAPLVVATAARVGVPPSLALALVGHESGFNPTAYRAEAAINDGSYGLTQILYATAKGEGYSGPASGLFDPAVNLEYGLRFLQRCLTARGGRVANALSQYNGGYRPSLGFGEVATAPVTVCLARDGQGNCIKTSRVAVGTFGNQAYVDAVLAKQDYFRAWLAEQGALAASAGIPPDPLAAAPASSSPPVSPYSSSRESTSDDGTGREDSDGVAGGSPDDGVAGSNDRQGHGSDGSRNPGTHPEDHGAGTSHAQTGSRHMKFLNGWKTALGAIGSVGTLLVASGGKIGEVAATALALAGHLDAVAMGAFGALGVLGLVHKVEKSRDGAK